MILRLNGRHLYHKPTNASAVASTPKVKVKVSLRSIPCVTQVEKGDPLQYVPSLNIDVAE